MDGTTASFLAGGEIPIKTSSGASTAELDTITFKEYGVKLSFTPKVTSTGTIELALEPEVSQLDQSFDSELGAALSTRRASTTAELRSGESVMIAGLLQSTSSRGAEGLPILGELPILGSLFRNSSLKEANTELLIIVTPTLANPDKTLTDLRNSIESKELSSGAEFFVDGKLSRSSFSVKDVVAGVGIKGNFGHVIPSSSHQSGVNNR
jgi:pilus assembly protein CpaC